MHVFSNNGLLLAHSLFEKEHEMRDRTHTFVVDSAPSLCFPSAIAPWLITHIMRLGDSPMTQYGSYLNQVYHVSCLRIAYRQMRKEGGSGVDALHRVPTNVLGADGSKPVMFLYGKRDRLVMPWEMRIWINRRRRLGGVGEVSAHMFDGRHVNLLKTNPQRYRNLVLQFMDSHTC